MPAADQGSSDALAVSRFVRKHVGSIVERWEARVRQELPRARALDRPTLIDHVPPLLEHVGKLVAALAHGEPADEPRALAAHHARARLAAGFELGEVIREYALLRRCVLEQIEGARPALEASAVQTLNSALDAAVAASVAEYTAARERLLRALEQVGAVALESDSLDELLTRLLRVMVESTPSADTATILMREGEVLRVRATIGLEKELEQHWTVPVGRGFSGTIAARGEPLELEDAAHDPRVLSDELRLAKVRGLYGVPLVAGGETLGVAHVGSTQAHALSADDRQLFGAIAQRAAAAILHTALRTSAQQQAKQQRAIAELGRRALGADVQELLDAAVRTIAETLGLDLVKVLELAPDGRSFVLRAGVGWDEELLGKARSGRGAASQEGFTLAVGAPVIVPDSRTETRFSLAPFIRQHGVLSGISVPIEDGSAERRHFGVLEADARVARRFTPDDVIFLESIGNLLSAAIGRRGDESRVLEAEQRFRRVVEQVPDHAIAVLDPQGRVTSWTGGAEQMFGWAEHEVLGRPLSELQPADLPEEHRPEALLERARVEGHVHAEVWRARKDGTRIWVSVTYAALVDPAGRLRGFAGVSRDMTERKRIDTAQRFLAQASGALAESLDPDETLSTLARLTTEGGLADYCIIDLVDASGDPCRVLMEHRDPAARAWARELVRRYPPSRDRPRATWRVIESGRAELGRTIDETALRAHAVDEEHLSMLRGAGMSSYLCVPMVARDRTLGAILLISTDPSRTYDPLDLDLAQDLARRAALAIDNAELHRQAREAIARREEILAVVSHDLRNPLSVMRMGSSLLAGGELEPAAAQTQGARMLRSAERMERLIQDLLDVSAIEKGVLTLVRRREDPAALIQEAANASRDEARQAGVALTHEATETAGPLPSVVVDRDRVLQVLGNLLANALRLTPRGGAVHVRAEAREGAVQLSVRDTGPGIPEEERAHVFERYWRGQGASYRGTGRGLAIAKGIVEAHGGHIGLESEVGKGTTFFIVLPTESDARAPNGA